MKQLSAFIKATLLGGVIVMLPAWLAVLLVMKALKQLQVFVKPVSSHLPESVAYPGILAIVLLVLLCFVVGLAIQTALGARIKNTVERHFLNRLPGYTILRGVTARLLESKESANFQPALIEIEEALVPGFIVEEHPGNRCTVFIPSVPTPLSGSIYIIDNNRVHPIDVPAVSVMKCISKWGGDSSKLVAAYGQRALAEGQKAGRPLDSSRGNQAEPNNYLS